MSYFQEKKFQNVVPDGSVTASTLVATNTNSTRVLKNVFVCNRGAADNFSIYHSSSATVTAALFHHEAISASTTRLISMYVAVESSGSPVVVTSGSPNNITFTGYGAEIIESPYND